MPEVFYDMELEDFFLMQKGFFDRRKRDELNFANVAAVIDAFAAGLGQDKSWSHQKFISRWFGEKPKQTTQEDLNQRSKRIAEMIAFREKIKAEKKNARTVKNNN